MLFKYVYKGPDLASVEIDQKNEIKWYVHGHYIGPPDAVWCVLHNKTHMMKPNIIHLHIHLPNHHTVIFRPEDNNLAQILQRGASQHTTLTAYFEANADRGPLGEEVHKHSYQEFPQFFTYEQNDRRWKLRQQGFALGRMYYIKPTAGELFYLRVLLTVMKGECLIVLFGSGLLTVGDSRGNIFRGPLESSWPSSTLSILSCHLSCSWSAC